MAKSTQSSRGGRGRRNPRARNKAEDSIQREPKGEHGHSVSGQDRPPKQEDPWPIDGYPSPPEECHCEPPAPASPRPERPPRVKPKGDDCCRQILEVLRCIPGIDRECLRVHKPKTPPKAKLANLCGALPVKERLGPILLLILRRFRDGITPGNNFEAALHTVLAGMPAKQRDALETALDAYDALPEGLRKCVFETRFDTWPDNKPLDAGFITRNIVGEMLALGRTSRFGPLATPPPAPGKVRQWEQSFELPGEPGKSKKVLAPWPWICAVSPVGQKAKTEADWFRNQSAYYPGPLEKEIQYQPHEFSRTCKVEPIPPAQWGGGANVKVECKNEQPVGEPFGECPGGMDYLLTLKPSGNACLKIIQIRPGSEVGLRGFNFFSHNAKVLIEPLKVNLPVPKIPLIAVNDLQGDTKAAPGKATCDVRDLAFFEMPATVEQGINDVPIPPGQYTLQLVVPNEFSYGVLPSPTAPKRFHSNKIRFELLPREDLKYEISTDEAFCEEETDGLGSDEPWFRALTAAIELPNAEGKFFLPLLNRVDIMTAENVDTGEFISFPKATLFMDTIGRKVVTIGVLGLEVDSEDAAREGIDNFFDAYELYLNNAFVILGSSIDAGLLGDAINTSIKAGALSKWVWVTGAVLLAILAAGILFAVWAEADLLAYDAITFTSPELFELTDPDPAHVRTAWAEGIDIVTISSMPLGKQPDISGTTSTYSEQRTYRNPDEGSRYRLVYRIKRV